MGTAVQHRHVHMAGIVVHDFKGDTAFVSTCRDGNVEYERCFAELLVAAEAVDKSGSAGGGGKRPVQQSGSGSYGEVAGK